MSEEISHPSSSAEVLNCDENEFALFLTDDVTL
jgi:hypothetical protein